MKLIILICSVFILLFLFCNNKKEFFDNYYIDHRHIEMIPRSYKGVALKDINFYNCHDIEKNNPSYGTCNKNVPLLVPPDNENNKKEITKNFIGENRMNKIKISDININNIRDFHTYQLLKKKVNSPNLYENDKKSSMDDDEFKMLFGEPCDKYYEGGSGFDSHYRVCEAPVLNGKYKKEEKYKENKSCPIPYKLNYTLKDLLKVDTSKMDIITKARYEKMHSKDIGGTYKISNKQCKECDYPLGCLNNYPSSRKNMYESQACRNGKNRVCKQCGKCETGITYASNICGEGGKDTECKPCKTCNNDEYKVYGCDTDNSPLDTACVKKSICYGKTLNGSKDPGKGNRTYMYKDGISHNDTKERYGTDRKCRKCEKCPDGFIHLRGCMGLNSTSNTVCQRYIDIDAYINKEVPEGIEKPNFYDREKLRKQIEEVNDNLRIHDDYLRSFYFTKNSDDEYDGLTEYGKSKNFTLSDINNPKIYENISSNIYDYLKPKFKKDKY